MEVASLMSVSSRTVTLRPLRNRLSSLDEVSLEGLLKPSMRETGPPGATWPSFWMRRKEGVSMECPTRSKTAANSLKTAGLRVGLYWLLVGEGAAGPRKAGGGSVEGEAWSSGAAGLLAGVADAGAGGGVEQGAGQFNGLAGAEDVVAGGDGEVDELGGAGVGPVGVVGEEVSERVDVAGEVAVIGLRTTLAH